MAMKLKVTRADVWSAAIEDRAGGVGSILEPLANAGANFEFMLARRTPEQPGKGILFVLPVKGAKVLKAAREAGFAKAEDIATVKIEGSNKAGTVAAITSALGNAGISFRGFSANAIGTKFTGYLALDSTAEAAKAMSVLKKL